MGRGQRANNCHINSKSSVGGPALKDTSPGLLLDRSVGPKIPSFSNSGESKAMSVISNTRLRTLLCLVIISPFFLQYKAWSP